MEEYLSWFLSQLTDADGNRLDANETAILTRLIEHVRSKTFDVQYAENLGRSFIPTASDIPADAGHVVEVIYDASGQARLGGNPADDAPRVDLKVSESTFKVWSIYAAYGWSLMDLRTAARTGVPLDAKKAFMAKRVIDTAIDEILAIGKMSGVNQDVGMKGLSNLTGVDLVTSDATGASWVGGTADQMLNDMHKVCQQPGATTKQLFETTDLILPIREWNIVSKTRGSTLDSRTVLQMFREMNPQITVSKWNRLDGAGAGGGVVNRLVAYHKSPEVLEAIIPQEFEQLPPQQRNYETLTNCHARCGGVRVHQPKGLNYMDLDASQV
jgi:hypothetical protein